MNDHEEWKDANPNKKNLPSKGRTVIIVIAGGIVLLILGIIGSRLKPFGLAVGAIELFLGIGMILNSRRNRANIKPGLICTIAGFFMMLTHPAFGVVRTIATYAIIYGSLGLIAFGIVKAIMLAWDVGKGSD